jgi:signal transduction histidine kinase
MLALRRGVRFVPWLVAALMAGVPGPVGVARAGEPQKQVLTLFSTGRGAQFAVVVERNLPTLLFHALNGGVDYSSEYVESAMLSVPEYPRAYRDSLRLKYQDRHFDLLIAVGRRAIEFLADNRDELFPNTPVVFYDIEPPRMRVPNSTGVVNELHFSRSLDVAVALQPDLKHVYVVSGAGMSDQENEQRAREEFRPFSDQLDFTYFSGLVTQDLEARLRRLPARSAVLVVLVTQDGAGQKVEQMADYVSRLASVANAPTYSWVDAALDAGIVGGSRRDQLAEVKTIATLAVRVLQGEHADDIPVAWPTLDVKQVDWRQLRRWGISEARVPAGTIVLFREPGIWDRYQRYIIGSLALMLAQTALIAGLLVQRSKRRRAEAELRGSNDRIRHLGGRLLHAQEAERARVARELHDDIGQQVAILSMELDSLRFDRHELDSAKWLSRAAERARGVAASVHALSHQLHPAPLQFSGLAAAISGLQRDFSRPHLSIAFAHRDVPSDIEPDVSLCLFRVAQESLRNAVQHSDAKNVWMDLAGGPTGLVLSITDDGKGFDINRVPSDGLGLISMRERVESVRGVLEIHSSPGSGTRLTVTVPVDVSSTAPNALTSA